MNLQSISTNPGQGSTCFLRASSPLSAGLQILRGFVGGAETFWTPGGGCKRKGKGWRVGGSPAFPHLSAEIAAWAAVITPFVRMKSGTVRLPNYTHVAPSFLLRPAPAAPAAGYGYPTDKGAGSRGWESPDGDAACPMVLSSPPHCRWSRDNPCPEQTVGRDKI